ncbi:MAG TPA: hypothetical protein VLI90_08885 [Tepidisphaeraceae bacterium]|nr:hypothetical protein [Tepidisphaeraceae bacterium]
MESAIGGNFADRSLDAAAELPLWQRVTFCDWLLAWADRHRWWLFAGVACFYLAAFNGQWRLQPDTALYLSLGRNLAEGKGYTYLGRPHHLAYPGWPWLIAVTFKLFGTQSLLPIHVVLFLIAIATIALSYRLFLLHSGRPTAVIVAVGLAVTKTFFTFGFELWSDMLFAAGVMAFLAGYEAVWRERPPGVNEPAHRARWYDFGLLVGGLAVAVVTRPTMWPLIVAITGAMLYSAIKGHVRWQRYVGAAALITVVAAATFALARHRTAAGGEQITGEYERYALQQASHLSQTLARAVTVNLRDLMDWAASDTLFQVRFGIFNRALSLLVIALGISLFRERVLWGLWFCALLITIVLVLALDRYFLPVIPLLVFAWWQLLVRINRALPRAWGNLVFLGLLGAAMGINISKCGGIVIQQRTRPFLAHYSRGEYAAVPALAAEIAKHTGDDAVVLIKPPYARVTEFLSARYVVNGFDLLSGFAAGTGALSRGPVYVVEPVDADIRDLLEREKLRLGPVVWDSAAGSSAPASPYALRLRSTQKADLR